jgi:hypothetical protein
MSKFNDKISILNVFTLIFEFCRCKNIFREKLVFKTAMSVIVATNEKFHAKTSDRNVITVGF